MRQLLYPIDDRSPVLPSRTVVNLHVISRCGNIDGSIDGRIVVSSSSPGVANDSTGPSYIGTITPGDTPEGQLDGDIAEILIYKGAGLSGRVVAVLSI